MSFPSLRVPLFRLTVALLLVFVSSGCKSSESVRWYKGNLHTHSLWSDGDDYPEMIVDWYKSNGYHFVALSDHNTLAEGEKWVDISTNAGGDAAFARYVERWGNRWVEQRTENGARQVRLKTFDEYKPRFDEPGGFLVIKAEEITDSFDGKPLHVNATNILDLIQPKGGTSVRDVLQNNVNSVFEQRARTGIPMIPHVNHPNFGWAVMVEDLVHLRGEQFFEVYNGHPAVHNDGDESRPGMDRMWDIILSSRLAVGLPVMYGLAVDDSHHYHEMAVGKSNPGRGWIMVDSPDLSGNSIVRALEQGDFYATSGVDLADVSFEDGILSLVINGEPGVSYTTQFLGTEEGSILFEDQTEVAGDRRHVTRVYSDQVGKVLAESTSLNPSYQLEGNELYVRAVITSSKRKINGYKEGEFEKAWVQPVVGY